MMFECFVKEYVKDYERQLTVYSRSHGLLVAAAVRMYGLDQESCYPNVIRGWQYWTQRSGGKNMGADWAAHGNLLFLTRKGSEKFDLGIPDEIVAEPLYSDELYYLWTFWFRYETEENGRKRYGELVRWVKDVSAAGTDWSKYSFGMYMAALAECYEIMTEEAYDQREVMAVLLRKAVKERSDVNVTENGAGKVFDAAMTAYAIALGIKTGALSRELHQIQVEEILLSIESECMEYRNHRIVFLTEETDHLAASACVLAYSAFRELREGKRVHEV